MHPKGISFVRLDLDQIFRFLDKHHVAIAHSQPGYAIFV